MWTIYLCSSVHMYIIAGGIRGALHELKGLLSCTEKIYKYYYRIIEQSCMNPANFLQNEMPIFFLCACTVRCMYLT